MSDARYFLFSLLLHVSFSVSSYLFQRTPPPSVVNYTKSHITGSLLGNKLIFTPTPPFARLPRRHRWCICAHRLQAGSICVADLSFFSVQPARHPGRRRDRYRKPNLTEQCRSSCRNTHRLHAHTQAVSYSRYVLGSLLIS